MAKQIKMNERGFSLLELMLVAALTVLLALLIGILFQKGQHMFDSDSVEASIQRNARRALHSVSVSIRKARRSTITIPAQPNNNQIAMDLPIFLSGTSCSAFASVADGTSPQTCDTATDCDSQCNNTPGTNLCVDNICRKAYTYAITTSNGISQLVVSASGESDRVVGNRIQSAVFRDNTMNLNLNPNEIDISLTAQANTVSENRTHSFVLSNIAQVRN